MRSPTCGRITALVVTQTCDLAQSKADSVVVCAVWSVARAVLQEPALSREARETATRHNLVMPAADAPDAEIDLAVGKIVDKSKALKKELDVIMGASGRRSRCWPGMTAFRPLRSRS